MNYMYHIIRLQYLIDWVICTFILLPSLAPLWFLDIMDPRSKAPTPTPPYCQDANKGFLPSDDVLHAGPEPFGYAPGSSLSGKHLESHGELIAGQEGIETAY